ncbi:TPA: hypothetical protein RQN76_003866 [Aeromonas dhakensis]|nr:hypothetical protein [Aeromonas dhakensis]
MKSFKNLIAFSVLASFYSNAAYPPIAETADAFYNWYYGTNYTSGIPPSKWCGVNFTPSCSDYGVVIEGALLKDIPKTDGYSYRFVVKGSPTVFRPASIARLKKIESNPFIAGGNYYLLYLSDFPYNELGGSSLYADRNSDIVLQMKSPSGALVNIDGDSTDDAQYYKPWNASQSYSKGMVVSHQGNIYESVYWTRNEPNELDRTGSLSGWKLIGGDALLKTPKWSVDIAYPKNSCVHNDGYKFIAKWYIAAGDAPPTIASDAQGWSKASDVSCPYPAS